MYENIRYSKPFLAQVIVRLDFIVPIKEFSTGLPDNLILASLRNFQIPEQSDFVNVQSGDTLLTSPVEWVFFNKSKSKKIIITANNLIFDYKEYDSFESLKSDFRPVIDALFDYKNEIMIRRFGLRYINRIMLEGLTGFEWNNYLRDDLLPIFNIKTEYTGNLSRAFQNLAWNFGEYNINFKYGMHNSDFPAILKEKLFILDYDAFADYAQNKENIYSNIDVFHDKIQDLFEYCIKPALQTMMGKLA